METNSYYIKIIGKANIPQALEIGHNFKVIADCSVTQEQKDDNENGTYDITYKVVPITAEISKDNGPTIKATDPRRNSQKIRNYLFKHYHDEGVVEGFDEIYDAFTFEVMANTPQMLRAAIKRVNHEK